MRQAVLVGGKLEGGPVRGVLGIAGWWWERSRGLRPHGRTALLHIAAAAVAAGHAKALAHEAVEEEEDKGADADREPNCEVPQLRAIHGHGRRHGGPARVLGRRQQELSYVPHKARMVVTGRRSRACRRSKEKIARLRFSCAAQTSTSATHALLSPCGCRCRGHSVCGGHSICGGDSVGGPPPLPHRRLRLRSRGICVLPHSRRPGPPLPVPPRLCRGPQVLLR
jgi:hypothetical protein